MFVFEFTFNKNEFFEFYIEQNTLNKTGLNIFVVPTKLWVFSFSPYKIL